MGITKSADFSEDQNKLSGIFKALGHPARIAIVQFLANQPGCITGDLVNELPLAQATVSQHLRALKDVNLIKGTIEGTSVCYCLNADVWSEVQPLVDNFISQSVKKMNCC